MKIGLVGSTNVGKSTIFNRIIWQFRAIVTDIPGTTRDIIQHETHIDDVGRVTFFDSPGLHDFTEEEPLIHRIIDESDIILFVIDDSVGITAKEQQIFDYITKKNKKQSTILIINKIDIKHKEKDYDVAINDYYHLWFEHMVGISAKKGKNLEDVKNMIIKKAFTSWMIKEGEQELKGEGADIKKEPGIHLAIIGKPNAGKSTLLNTLMKKTLAKVENKPGTTRDYIAGRFILQKKKYIVYDTAGIRKKWSVHGIEKIANDKTMDMLKYIRPIVLFIIDATEGISHRDMTIIQEINMLALPMVICLNKIDLLDAKQLTLLGKKSQAILDFAKYMPIFPISAKTQKGIPEIFKHMSTIKKEAEKRIETSQLNDIIGKEFISRPPRFPKNKACKILYVTQVDINAPTFVAFVNHKDRANFAFKRWLENSIRKHFGFIGTPIVIRFKERQDSRLKKTDEE